MRNERPLWISLKHTGQVISTQGASGHAIALGVNGKQSITFSPSNVNVLDGAGTFDLATALKIVVTINIPGHNPQKIAAWGWSRIHWIGNPEGSVADDTTVEWWIVELCLSMIRALLAQGHNTSRKSPM